MYYFSDTPYRRFSEIQEAVRKGEMRLSYNRATAIRVASERRKRFAMLYLYIPAVTAVVLYILTMYLPIPKTVILFALAGLVLYPFVPYISRIMVIAGVVLIFLPIWFLRDSMWVLAIGAALIVIRFTYDLWWLFISRVTDRASSSAREKAARLRFMVSSRMVPAGVRVRLCPRQNRETSSSFSRDWMFLLTAAVVI